MPEYPDITKRQIEMLGILFSETLPKPARVTDLACFFNVDDVSIKRDLSRLRSMGIDIHSSKKEGVVVSSTFRKRDMVELILRYSSMSSRDEFLDKSTFLLAEKFGDKLLSNFILLQMCAESRLLARIKYLKEANTVVDLTIEPLLLYQDEGHWCVLVQGRRETEQYLLEKISEVTKTDTNFDRREVPEEAYIVADSCCLCSGPITYTVKLRVSHDMALQILAAKLMLSEKMTMLESGSILFEGETDNLSEIAVWIASKGRGIIVEEPASLKERVIHLASGTLSNYEDCNS